MTDRQTRSFLTARLPRRPLHFDLTAGPEERATIAQSLELVDLPALRIAGTIRPDGREDWQFDAVLDATVVQPCVVTLDPVTTTLSEIVRRRFVADLLAPTEAETEMPADESVEHTPRMIDIGVIMVEALDLALPLYPRADGATHAAGPEDSPTPERRPFQGLRELLSKPDPTD